MSVTINHQTNHITATNGSVTTDGRTGSNLIINGAMQVAQRGTSVTGVTSSGYSTVDRMNHNSSGATLDMSRQDFAFGQVDIPSQFKHYFRINATTGANNAGLRYRVEDVQSVPEGKVTLSFYAKGTNPNGGNLELDLSQSFGSGGSTSVSLPAETITLTSSWQRFIYTVTIPSISGKTVGAGSNFQIYCKQPNGDNSTNAWTLDITGVQLEVGDTATPFEHKSYDQENLACQRYFQRFGGGVTSGRMGVGGWNNNTSADISVFLNHEMRVIPTVTAPSKGRLLDLAVAWHNVSSFTTSESTTKYVNFGVSISGSSAAAQGDVAVLGAGGVAFDYFMDAEL